MINYEYQAFLKYVFSEYIEKRIRGVQTEYDHRLHGPMYDLFRLQQALQLLRYIQDVCTDESDIYDTFHSDKLRRTIQSIRLGASMNHHLAKRSGFLDAWDSYYEEIIEGVSVELIPEFEFEFLKDYGFREPKTDLEGIIYSVKKRSKTEQRNTNTPRISSRLKKAEEELSGFEDCFLRHKEEEPARDLPRKERRWFKGVAQIGQGAALSIIDIALAADILDFPVSSEARTWGALVSATTGVGMILNGIGELRGE